MEKIFIENRLGKKISVLIEKPDEPIGLAFIMHGLGSKDDLFPVEQQQLLFDALPGQKNYMLY